MSKNYKFKLMVPLLLLNIKDYVVNMLESKKSLFRFNDPVVKFLKLDHISENKFKHNLRMLPLELVEEYGPRILQDAQLYNKYYKSEYDVFQQIWDKHFQEYERDRIELYEMYMYSQCDENTPLETYNKLNDLMIKIERRSLMLGPQWKPVIQKHKRQSGDERDYEFARAHWVDGKGQKKRMINRLVGEKHERLEEEVALLFHRMGFAVHRGYEISKGIQLDMVIEREKQKTVIEIKQVDKDLFNNIFIFDELVKRFEEEYPNG